MSEAVQIGEIVQNKPFTKLPKLTRKQKAFVNEIVKNPKQSATQAVMKTYDVNNEKTASVIASENLAKPSIISHLDKYSVLAEQSITNNMIRFKDSENIKEVALSVDLAKYIHDKTHGKAVTKNLNLNAEVNIEDLLNNLI